MTTLVAKQAATESPYADLIRQALLEDNGCGDITTKAVVGATDRAHATITQKQQGVVYGIDIAEATFVIQAQSHELEIIKHIDEGVFRKGGPVLTVRGDARAILNAERTALNFLQRLSGIATLTAKYVAAIEGTGAKLLDTRKTTPGLRTLEKAAVAAGGGVNHRIGLYDAVLIKENHIALAGGIEQAVRRLKDALPTHSVEIECRSLAELEQALEEGVDRVLLDNMSVDQITKAVHRAAGRAELEASGGITLDNIRAFAETGVDFISVGAITHSAPALDMSLTLEAI